MAGIDTYTKLILHGDGDDASTTITDSSSSPKTVTANANAQLDTAQKVFGSASVLFDGTGDYLSIPDSDDWTIGNDSFTVDFRVRFAALTGGENNATPIFAQQLEDGNNGHTFYIYGGKLYYSSYEGGVEKAVYSATWAPVINTWYHVAFVKDGSNALKIFIDGTGLSVTTTTAWQSVSGVTASLNIGTGNVAGTRSLNGWIDEFRWSKGIARWTANFTPPTEAYSSESAGSTFTPKIIII